MAHVESFNFFGDDSFDDDSGTGTLVIDFDVQTSDTEDTSNLEETPLASSPIPDRIPSPVEENVPDVPVSPIVKEEVNTSLRPLREEVSTPKALSPESRPTKWYSPAVHAKKSSPIPGSQNVQSPVQVLNFPAHQPPPFILHPQAFFPVHPMYMQGVMPHPHPAYLSPLPFPGMQVAPQGKSNDE